MEKKTEKNINFIQMKPLVAKSNRKNVQAKVSLAVLKREEDSEVQINEKMITQKLGMSLTIPNYFDYLESDVKPLFEGVQDILKTGVDTTPFGKPHESVSTPSDSHPYFDLCNVPASLTVFKDGKKTKEKINGSKHNLYIGVDTEFTKITDSFANIAGVKEFDEECEFTKDSERIIKEISNLDENEYIYVDHKRRLLSVQFTVLYEDCFYLFFFEMVSLNSSHGRSSTFNNFLDYIANALKLKFGSKHAYSFHLFGHYIHADLSIFNQSVNIYKRLTSINNGLISVRPLSCIVHSYGTNAEKGRVSYTINDTYTLACKKKKSLSSIGEIVGINKIEDPECDKERMDIYLTYHYKRFVDYAMNDSAITLLYGLRFLMTDGKIPVTIPQLSAMILKDYMMKTFNWSENDYIENYQSSEVILCDAENGRKKKKLDDNTKVSNLVSAKTAADRTYRGGLNFASFRGYFRPRTFDVDLRNAYATGMALTPMPDHTKPIKTILAGTEITSDMVGFDTLFYGAVTFSIPTGVKYPCFAIRDKKDRGLITPLQSATGAYATGPDVAGVLYQGGSVVAFSDCYVLAPCKNEDGSIKRPLMGLMKELIRLRNEAKEEYGPDSGQQLLLKAVVTNMYGKTAQGITKKSRYDFMTLKSEDMGKSAVTNSFIASHTTALVRVILSLSCEAVTRSGYHVLSCTTDGFITSANICKCNNLNIGEIGDLFKHARVELTGCPDIFDLKHKNWGGCYNASTRANSGMGIESVFAKGGIQNLSKEDFRKCISTAGTDNFLDSVTIFTSPKDYLVKHLDFYVHDKEISKTLCFDMKRKPCNPETITDDKYEYINFDTEPYETMEEFDLYRNARDCTKRLNTIVAYKKVMSNVKVKKRGSGRLFKTHDEEIIEVLRHIWIGNIDDVGLRCLSWSELTEVINSVIKKDKSADSLRKALSKNRVCKNISDITEWTQDEIKMYTNELKNAVELFKKKCLKPEMSEVKSDEVVLPTSDSDYNLESLCAMFDKASGDVA